jgi:hypothetical protein
VVVTLGPWILAKGVDKEYKPLAAVMGDEAWKTVSDTAGFSPKEAEKGKPAAKGYTISGRITTVLKEGNTVHIRSVFTVQVDGSFSTMKEVVGDGSAEGVPPEDALRPITKTRVSNILVAIKSGRVKKVR